MVRYGFALLLGLLACACSKSSPTTPSTNTPTTPAPTLYTIGGRVTSTLGDALSGATVRVTDGPNAGKSVTTDAGGNFLLTDLTFAGFTVEASHAGYVSSSRGGILQQGSTTARADFSLAPDGPRTTIVPGTHTVGTDIVPGRYFTDPGLGCYWERLSGFGGTLNDVIANDFVGFDAPQLIVDILGSDRGFSSDSDCRTWSMSPRAAPSSGITPGTWLVNAQIAPGTYRITAAPGCYWERLRNFEGRIASIIANDFVAGGGPVIVSISPSDVGFHADDDCGTQWTQVLTLDSGSVPTPAPSGADIEANRTRNRQQSGR